jgi:hypothetical protein
MFLGLSVVSNFDIVFEFGKFFGVVKIFTTLCGLPQMQLENARNTAEKLKRLSGRKSVAVACCWRAANESSIPTACALVYQLIAG